MKRLTAQTFIPFFSHASAMNASGKKSTMVAELVSCIGSLAVDELIIGHPGEHGDGWWTVKHQLAHSRRLIVPTAGRIDTNRSSNIEFHHTQMDANNYITKFKTTINRIIHGYLVTCQIFLHFL